MVGKSDFREAQFHRAPGIIHRLAPRVAAERRVHVQVRWQSHGPSLKFRDGSFKCQSLPGRNAESCPGNCRLEHLPKLISEMVGQTCRFASIPGRESPPFRKLILATNLTVLIHDFPIYNCHSDLSLRYFRSGYSKDVAIKYYQIRQLASCDASFDGVSEFSVGGTECVSTDRFFNGNSLLRHPTVRMFAVKRLSCNGCHDILEWIQGCHWPICAQ